MTSPSGHGLAVVAREPQGLPLEELGTLRHFLSAGYLFGMSLIVAGILLLVRKRSPNSTPASMLAGALSAAGVFAVDFWGFKANHAKGFIPALALVWAPFAVYGFVRWILDRPR